MGITFNPFTGTLDFTGAGGGGTGTPSAPDTSVQFNDGGNFGGDADLTWNKTTNTLTLVDIPITAGAGQVASSALVIGSDPNDIFEITSAPTNGNVFVISGGGAATQVGNYFATEVDIQGGADTGTGAGGLVIVGAGHKLTGNPVGGRVSIESGFGSPNGEITFKPGGSDAWTIDGTSGDLSGASGKNLATAAGYYQGSEMTAPSAGAANTFRLFAQDNGGGKTQLMILFATGAAQQLAVQA